MPGILPRDETGGVDPKGIRIGKGFMVRLSREEGNGRGESMEGVVDDF